MGDEVFERYVGALIHFLEQCLDDVRHRPEAALWNVRRAAESMAGAVLICTERKDPWTDKDPSLDGFVNRIARTHAELGGRMRTLKDQGNAGAHFRAWITGQTQPWTDAGYAASILAHVCRLFVAECEAQRWPLAPDARARIVELCGQLGEAGKDAFGRQDAAESMGSLHGRLAAMTAERDHLVHRVEGLTRQLEAGVPAASRPVSPRPSAVPRWALVAVVGAVIVGGGFGGLVGRLSHGVVLEWPALAAVSATAAVGGAVAPSSEPAAASCPSGTVDLPAREFTLNQPVDRTRWPAPARPTVVVSHPRVCLDAAPVATADYDRCVAVGACTARATACKQSVGDKPVNCVTQPQADAYCRWTGGALPSLVEWEAALRAATELRASPSLREWTADVYPAPALERGPPVLVAGAEHYMARGRPPVGVIGDDSRGGWEHRGGFDSIVGFRCAHHP